MRRFCDMVYFPSKSRRLLINCRSIEIKSNSDRSLAITYTKRINKPTGTAIANAINIGEI